MDNFYLSAVIRELKHEIVGRVVTGLTLADSTLLINLRLAGRRHLLASLDRSSPALYLSHKSSKEPRRTGETSAFLLLSRNRLVDARLMAIRKSPLDRVVELLFEKKEASETQSLTSLVLAFTGRSANGYLVDDQRQLLASLFEASSAELPAVLEQDENFLLTRGVTDSTSQPEIIAGYFAAGSVFSPQHQTEFIARCGTDTPAAAFRSLVDDLSSTTPLPLIYSRIPLEEIGSRVVDPQKDLLLSNIELKRSDDMVSRQFPTLSDAAEAYYSHRVKAIDLKRDHDQLRHRLSREVKKLESSLARIESDRVRFGDPETLKRCGDLILANLATARIRGNKVTVVDYYDPEMRKIEIEIPEGLTLEQAANDYFGRYRKASRAVEATAARRTVIMRKLDPLKRLLRELSTSPTRTCIDNVAAAVGDLLETTVRTAPGKRKKRGVPPRVGRWFRSSDGHEIAVGKSDRENDALTFRIARPYDLWLHAADYPGSHVIVRNPAREEVPYRTIAEAAALAAFHSQARNEGKAAVHYTKRKFVTKPPRSKPGLVRLSSFKTIMVEPRGDLKRIE